MIGLRESPEESRKQLTPDNMEIKSLEQLHLNQSTLDMCELVMNKFPVLLRKDYRSMINWNVESLGLVFNR